MDRIYMNRIDGQRRIHVEITDSEVSDLLEDLQTDPEHYDSTAAFLAILDAAEETFSPVVAEGRRDRTARTAAARQTTGQDDTDCPACGDTGACNGGPCAHPDAAPAVGQPAEAQATDEQQPARTDLYDALDQSWYRWGPPGTPKADSLNRLIDAYRDEVAIDIGRHALRDGLVPFLTRLVGKTNMRTLLARHRAAVLREAAELGRELSRQGYSAQEIAARLDRMAEEART